MRSSIRKSRACQRVMRIVETEAVTSTDAEPQRAIGRSQRTGESITITKHGRPVAKLVPVSPCRAVRTTSKPGIAADFDDPARRRDCGVGRNES
jgi:hypothetical protein